MKRSKQVVLVLFGAMTVAPLGCSRKQEMVLSPSNTYTNNHYVPGAGYYHAPFGGWFPFPYNAFRPGQGYYSGGRWSPQPGPTDIQASNPDPTALRTAQQQHSSTVRRGGFGSSSRSGIS